MPPVDEHIAFDQPLNERTRSFLRLEFLLAELEHHRSDRSEWGMRACVRTLLDTLSVLGRTDLKTELLKDLGEQQAALQRLASRNDVSQDRLSRVLQEITAALSALHQSTAAHPAALLRENDFLYAIHSRSAIPGGTCRFDLAAYHRWLSRGPEATQRDLDQWSRRLIAFRTGVDLSLRLLRTSSQAQSLVAHGGVFLHIPQAHYSLVRVQIAPDADVYPEISASKHRIAIRFMALGDVNTRSMQETRDVPFQLQCCSPAGALAGTGATATNRTQDVT
jgi:cell division protein ZapD